ncbi:MULTISPECIES: twin-arginine translocase subunit TatE [Erwinia]|uniref:Sec-independent protein translocase protein TatA n=1 Tax=Erwinia pyrifoliae TaxID=79967 RepID=A0ABY5X4V6_ERWPY|nr:MULTISPECIES: twin-arginine translocase subunit TatE [Erwinia]ADP11915.1 twin arginine translocase protein E [Erwinia sp. Ejp617]AUX72062.1 twin-arginine translocase subunit TatA [Erwinia pyrifoliae]MCA8877697.1 twin-arginine translocase subunit TatE [Erwinia pyrifoliae]MCT2388311.1 twin-arginine translocase subunit TatE [Erwinia pyrifoliae]MCU8586481.1 twin-arginine translocase subunit TatE [Erwinia pyrifoliae]
MEGISFAKLLIVGALIVLLFGTRKLRTLGADLGSAIKGFKKAMQDEDGCARNTGSEEKNAGQAAHKE